MKKLLGILAAIAALSCVHAEDTADMEIYIDYVVGQWAFGGTAIQNPVATDVKRSYTYSVQTTIAPGEDFEIIQTWGGVPINGYSAIEFYIRASGTLGQNLNLSARINGNYRTVRQLSQYVTLSTTTWRRVRIPLADLGVQAGERLQIFKMEGPAGQPLGSYNIDDIKLIKPAFVGAASISVNAASVLRTLPDRMFGVGSFTWDTQMLTQDTKDKVMAAGVKFFNFPGGSTADIYDWQNNVNKLTGDPGFVNTDSYLQFTQDVGANKMITVNYGSGTPEEAAAWLQYVNIQHNGNVTYWSIGNESYHPDHYDMREPPYQHDAETYAIFVSQCIQQMKAIDPSIKIGIVGTIAEWDWPQRTTVINPRTGQPANGWGAVVLSKLAEFGTLPDYYDFHYYATAPNSESDATLLQMTGGIQNIMSTMRQMITDYLGDPGQNLPVLLTETNSTWMPIGRQSTSMTNALYLADFWGNVAKAGFDSFVWWNLHNSAENTGNFHPSLQGWRNNATFGILSLGVPNGIADPVNTRYPTYFAIKMLSKFARPGDSMVQVTSNNELLAVYASKNATTNRVRLLVINKSKRKDFLANIALPNYTAPTTARVYRYTTSQDTASQDLTSTQASTQLRSINRVPTVRFSFPRYSLTVIEL